MLFYSTSLGYDVGERKKNQFPAGATICISFLLHPKDVHVRLIGISKCPSLNECGGVCEAPCHGRACNGTLEEGLVPGWFPP